MVNGKVVERCTLGLIDGEGRRFVYCHLAGGGFVSVAIDARGVRGQDPEAVRDAVAEAVRAAVPGGA